MRVLQINATYGYSSTGVIVKDIGDMLCENGEESFFAYQSCNSAPKNGYRIGNKLDWKLHALFCRLSGKQAYYSKASTKKLIKYIASIKPDIVHLHNLHSNYAHLNLLLDFLAKKNIATVITMHDCWYFTGKCFHYADIGCNRFEIGCGNCPKKNAPPRSLFFDKSFQVLKDRYSYFSKIRRLSIVGCSDWICREAKRGVLKDFYTVRIYNGVDINVFRPYNENILEKSYGDNCFYALGMANKWLLPANRQLLYSVIKILKEDYKLVLIGCNETQIKELQKLSSNIIALGFIHDREKLAKYYSAANVFVNVTLVDTLPTVNMESICCGTPVITYDSCGSPELVLEGCGRVVKKYDSRTLIESMQSRVKKIESDVLKNARKQFDKKECYKEYLTVYNNTIKGDA